MDMTLPATGTIAQRIALIEAECSGVWSSYHVSSWERERLREWKDRTSLTERQLETLEQIESKVFGDG